MRVSTHQLPGGRSLGCLGTTTGYLATWLPSGNPCGLRSLERSAGDQYYELALQRALAQEVQQFGGCSAQEFFEFFRQLPRQDHGPFGKNFHQFAQQFLDAIGRFIQDQGALETPQAFQLLPALAGLVRQEAYEMKF